ncbi:MAG TPA: PIG-L family deacetylase [Phycisphaerae bacterium]|nr:PIG-L family deacetylase [Phycisphaerae bacterium]
MAELLPANRPFSIRSIRIPPALRILVLGPHPDDFDAIGVTMRFFHNNGGSIHVTVIRTGGGVEDSYCSPPTLEAKAALRDAEQRRSCRFFGLANESLTLLDMEQDEKAHPRPTPANLNRVRDIILRCSPDFVFLPHGNDTNIGHRMVYAMFRQVVGEECLPVAAFLNRDPKTIDMRIDGYMEFEEDEARWKGQLLRMHATQHQRNLNTRNHGFDERILDLNRNTARKLGITQAYAEAFEVEFHGRETEEPRGQGRLSGFPRE